jgi:hypothetical protein
MRDEKERGPVAQLQRRGEAIDDWDPAAAAAGIAWQRGAGKWEADM